MSTDAKPSNVRELYVQAARIKEDAERQAFLDEACGGQIELRQRVEDLLAARRAEGDNLLQLATSDSISGQNSFSWNGDDIGKTIDSHPEAMADDRTRDDSVRGQIDISTHPMIANYRLLEELGHGGMGTVYMAAQSKPVKRQVALKVIKPGMDSKEVIARFEAERQALAMMDHPHIARVLDGGTTDEGRPYFVMELVRGVPITEFCKRKTLPLRERLELFVDVCHAVQHAHQKGIIHRDLKPSNIMVTLHDGKPVVKVIDFGVAKALHQELTERTLFTQFSQMLGTPLYMAPEQAEMSGLGVDTRSDIYSLGVVLYELLTGTTPFDRDTLSKLGIDGIRKLIQEQEPPRPSARISTLKAADRSTIEDQREIDTEDIAQQLNREVDWIVMKALEKDRERRYETANAFAADIQRYLNDEPVEAYPPSAPYRLKKIAKKHKVWLTTAALFIAMLVTSTAVSAMFAFQTIEAKKETENQREEAVQARQLAEERMEQSRVDFDRALKSMDLIVEQVSSAEFAQLPGVDKVRKDILQKMLAFYDEIIIQHDNDPYARLQRARSYKNISEIYDRLGDGPRQSDSLRKATAVLDGLIAEYPDNVEYKYELFGILHARQAQQERPAADRIADMDRALEIAMLLPDDSKPSKWELVVKILSVKSLILPADDPETDRIWNEAVRLVNRHHLTNVGVFLWASSIHAERAGDLESAISWTRKGIERNRNRSVDDSYPWWKVRGWFIQDSISRSLTRLASLYVRQGSADDANRAFQEAYENALSTHREYSHVTRVQDTLITLAREYSQFLESQQRSAKAAAILREIVNQAADLQKLHDLYGKTLVKQDAPLDGLSKAIDEHPKVMTYYRYRSAAYRDRGDLDQALVELNRVVEMEPENNRWRTARIELHAERGEWPAVASDLIRVVELSPDSYYLQYQSGLVAVKLDQIQQYRERCRQMLSASSAPLDNGALMHFTAWTCALSPDALEDYEPAIKLGRQTVELDSGNQQFLSGLGAVLLRAGKYDEAKEQLEKALEVGEDDNTSTSYIHYFLAMTRQALGDTKEAKTHLRKANEVAESELSDSPAWNRRLTLELLRKEAESLIDDPIGETHVD